MKPTYHNQRVALVTREYPGIVRKTNYAKTEQTNILPNVTGEIQRRLVAVWSKLAPSPSMNFHHFPPVCTGEVSLDLPWSWVWCSYTGVLSTRITRRKRRAAEKQSRLILVVALQEGS